MFGSMKKIGGKPVVDYLLGYVQDKDGIEKRRTAAMAALARQPGPQQRRTGSSGAKYCR